MSVEAPQGPLGPGLRTAEGEVKYPFQELKERLGPQKYDAAIIFGEGPIMDVYAPWDLTPTEQTEWEVFSADPRNENQPKFRVVSNPWIYSDRKERQGNAALVKRRWGEQNALAGGLLLYLGVTDTLILTGGKTGGPDKPAEADLQEEIIIDNYGTLYYYRDTGKKFDPENRGAYDAFISAFKEKHILKETSADSTLANIAMSSTLFPEYVQQESKLIAVSSEHHDRGQLIAQRLTGVETIDFLSAQALLEQQGETRGHQELVDIMQNFRPSPHYVRGAEEPDYRSRWEVLNGHEEALNKDLIGKIKGEEKWRDFLEDTQDPNKLLHWIGFAGYVPAGNLQRIFADLSTTETRTEAATVALARAGIDFMTLKDMDLTTMDPDAYRELQQQLLTLTDRAIRDEGYHAVMAYPKKQS